MGSRLLMVQNLHNFLPPITPSCIFKGAFSFEPNFTIVFYIRLRSQPNIWRIELVCITFSLMYMSVLAGFTKIRKLEYSSPTVVAQAMRLINVTIRLRMSGNYVPDALHSCTEPVPILRKRLLGA